MSSTTNSTMNSTGTGGSIIPSLIWHNEPYNVAMFVLYIIVIVVALIGNFLVCIAVCINPRLRQNVASYFIVSLAISDILTAAFSMPFDLESFTTFGKWGHSEIWCIVWTTAYLITVPTSMWNLFMLSIDRYNTLKNPWDRFRESPFMTKKKAVAIISLVWILCMTYALVPAMGWKAQESTLIGLSCHFNMTSVYSIASAIVNFYLPMVVMCLLYYKIYQIARTQYLRPSSGIELKIDSNYSPAAKAKTRKRESRAYEEEYHEEKCQTQNPSTPDNQAASPNGEANLAMEDESENIEKIRRSGTMIEVLDTPEGKADASRTRNGEQLTIRKEEKDQDLYNSASVGDESTETKEEITSNATQSVEEIHCCGNTGSQPKHNSLRRDADISESIVESESSEECTKLACGSNNDKDLNDGQNGNNKVDDNEELEEGQTSQTKNNEHSGLFDCQEPVDTDKKDEQLQNSHDSLYDQESSNDEQSTAPQSPCEENTHTENNRGINDEGATHHTTTPAITHQDRNPIPNVEHNPQSVNVDLVVADGGASILDHSTDHVTSSIEQNKNYIPNPHFQNTSSQITPQMREFLKRKLITGQTGIQSASSIESLESISTVQSTLDDHNREVNNSRSNLSMSRETLTNFGSMEDITKRTKIFVKNKKAARTISIIVGVFLLCWFPRTTFSIIFNICKNSCFTSQQALFVRLYMSHSFTLLGYISCAMNPIIYTFRNVQFRKSYRKIFSQIFPCLARPN